MDESLQIFAHYLPWTSFGQHRGDGLHLNSRGKGQTFLDIPFGRQVRLLPALAHEMLLYEYAVHQFGRQLLCVEHGTNLAPVSNLSLTVTTSKLVLAGSYFSAAATDKHRGGWRAVIHKLAEMGVVSFPKPGQNRSMPLSGIAFIDCVEHQFYFGSTRAPMAAPWVGVVHWVQITEQEWEVDSLHAALSSPLMLSSLPFCVMLVALSQASAMQVRKFLPGVRVEVLLHPVPSNLALFSFPAFKRIISSDTLPSVIFVGSTYRKVDTLYRLPGNGSTYRGRIWLPGSSVAKAESYFKKQVLPLLPMAFFPQVKVQYTSDFDEYDQLLRTNIVLIDLLGASANNAVVECLAAQIPCIIRKLDAVEEYLGSDYPLFFSDMDDLMQILSGRTRLLKLLGQAHRHLAARMLTLKNSVGSFGMQLRRLVERQLWGGDFHPVNRGPANRPARIRHESACQKIVKDSLHLRPPNASVESDCTAGASPSSCSSHLKAPVRIAVCFFGVVSRSLRLASSLIDLNVLGPLRGIAPGATDVFVHAIIDAILEGRAADSGTSRPAHCHREFLRVLQPCAYSMTKQLQLDLDFNISHRAFELVVNSKGKLHPYNDLATVKNILRSRFSLYQVSLLVAEHEAHLQIRYTFVTVVRPDTVFAMPIPYNIHTLLADADIVVPDFQHGRLMKISSPNSSTVNHGGGVNDRFAFGHRNAMLNAHMTQFTEQLLAGPITMVDSEHLLCQHLVAKKVVVKLLPLLCVMRIRGDGSVPKPDYTSTLGQRSSCIGPQCCNPLLPASGRVGRRPLISASLACGCPTIEEVHQLWPTPPLRTRQGRNTDKLKLVNALKPALQHLIDQLTALTAADSELTAS
jgi:hypothetical protein